MAVFERMSQFWLPSLLFVLSLASILFTWRNDDLPAVGPEGRPMLSDQDLDGLRQSLNNSLHNSADWRLWCRDPSAAREQLRIPDFQTQSQQTVWSEMHRHLPRTVQDAVLRCQSSHDPQTSRILSCLHLTPDAKPKTNGLFLLELSVELRKAGKKTLLTCAQALTGQQSIELAFFYSYYWTEHSGQRPLNFQHLTGGTRILPALAAASLPDKATLQP